MTGLTSTSNTGSIHLLGYIREREEKEVDRPKKANLLQKIIFSDFIVRGLIRELLSVRISLFCRSLWPCKRVKTHTKRSERFSLHQFDSVTEKVLKVFPNYVKIFRRKKASTWNNNAPLLLMTQYRELLTQRLQPFPATTSVIERLGPQPQSSSHTYDLREKINTKKAAMQKK